MQKGASIMNGKLVAKYKDEINCTMPVKLHGKEIELLDCKI